MMKRCVVAEVIPGAGGQGVARGCAGGDPIAFGGAPLSLSWESGGPCRERDSVVSALGVLGAADLLRFSLGARSQ